MTTNYLSTLALVATFFFAGHSYAGDKKVENEKVKSTTTISQPRDAASGLPTGKRQHKPVRMNKRIDKSSPQQANGAHPLCSPSKTCTKKAVRAGYRLCPDGVTMLETNPLHQCAN